LVLFDLSEGTYDQSEGSKPENETDENIANYTKGKFSSMIGKTARVISVDEKNGCASMHVPGMGVRPFHFSNLFDGAASQR
jgi:hypothetical protein